MSVFDWQTGKPTAMNTAKERQYANRSIAQTKHVEKKRKEGTDIGTLTGISKAGDEQRREWLERQYGQEPCFFSEQGKADRESSN